MIAIILFFPLWIWRVLRQHKQEITRILDTINQRPEKGHRRRVLNLSAPEASLFLDRKAAQFYKHYVPRNFFLVLVISVCFFQSYLVVGYRQGAYWWNNFTLLRNGLISVFTVAFAFEKQTQSILTLFVVFVSSVVLALARPYVDSRLNAFELASHFSWFLTSFLGLFTADATRGFTQARPIALVANALYFLIGFGFTVRHFFFAKIHKVVTFSEDSKNRHSLILAHSPRYLPKVPHGQARTPTAKRMPCSIEMSHVRNSMDVSSTHRCTLPIVAKAADETMRASEIEVEAVIDELEAAQEAQRQRLAALEEKANAVKAWSCARSLVFEVVQPVVNLTSGACLHGDFEKNNCCKDEERLSARAEIAEPWIPPAISLAPG